MCSRLCDLQAQRMDALALEAVFSVCQADIYAKQHSFARATALLDAAERPQACSPSMQLCIAARASAVRAALHRLQGDPRGATQHCQAGVQLASRALQTILQSSGGKVLPIGQNPAKRRSKQGAGRSTGAAAQSSASAGHSAAAEQKPEERGDCDRSVPVSAWHVRSQLAQSHASMAELSWEAGDSEGARNCLQAVRTACCDPMPGAGDASEAFPIQTAAVLYQESMYQLEQHEQVTPCMSRIHEGPQQVMVLHSPVRHDAARFPLSLKVLGMIWQWLGHPLNACSAGPANWEVPQGPVDDKYDHISSVAGC